MQYRATFHAAHGGTIVETFDAPSSAAARAAAARYRASFGVCARYDFPRITIKKRDGRIVLERGRPLGYVVRTVDGARSMLVQTDWDYPSIATTFGWDMSSVQRIYHESAPCQHYSTDGTIDCGECGLMASSFISAAADWLDDHDGTIVEDPGYFAEEQDAC